MKNIRQLFLELIIVFTFHWCRILQGTRFDSVGGGLLT